MTYSDNFALKLFLSNILSLYETSSHGDTYKYISFHLRDSIVDQIAAHLDPMARARL